MNITYQCPVFNENIIDKWREQQQNWVSNMNMSNAIMYNDVGTAGICYITKTILKKLEIMKFTNINY